MPVVLLSMIFVMFAVLTGLIIYEMFQRSTGDKHLHQLLKYLNRQIERNNQELSRHRYYIAVIRRQITAMGGPDLSELQAGEKKADEKMLEAAVAEIDKEASKPAPVSTVIDKKSDAKDTEKEKTKESSISAGLSDAIARKDTDDDIPQKASIEVTKVSDDHLLKVVKEAIRRDEVDIIRQPIVSLPQRKTRHYEFFSRIKLGKDGYVSAGRFISLADNANLVPAIDNLILLRTLQLLRKDDDRDVTSGYFCNISAETLNNRSFMNALIDFLDMNPALAPRLIFEMKQRDLANLKNETKMVIDGLDKLGCRFSMDQVKLLGIDPIALEDKRISFVKIDANLLLKGDDKATRKHKVMKLKSMLESSGVEMIIEKIETEKQLMDLMDFYIDYGQGYLFGAPE